MKYSGRTTALEHKSEPWYEKDISDVQDCIQQKTVFCVQWSNCPVEVAEEVMEIWAEYELMNDVCYWKWESKYDGDKFPVVDEYLKSRGITECLIHYWW